MAGPICHFERHPVDARYQLRQGVATLGVDSGRSAAGHDIAFGHDHDVGRRRRAPEGDNAFDAAGLLRRGERAA